MSRKRKDHHRRHKVRLPRPIGLRLYLDVNVYRQVEEEADWRALRRQLREAGHLVVAGDPIVGEIILLADARLRQKALSCVVGLRDEWTTGVPGEAMIHEVYEVLQRRRPDWIVGTKRHGVITTLATRRRSALAKVAERPDQLLKWHQELAARYQQSAEAIQKWQKASVQAIGKGSYRDALTNVLPANVTLPDGMSDAELEWRLLAAERWHQASNGIAAEEVNYLIDVRPGVSAAEWANFWLQEVDIREVPATAMHGLIRYHQLLRSLKGIGNMIDAMHVTAALGCDVFVTCDRRLGESVQSVHDLLPDIYPRALILGEDEVKARAWIAGLTTRPPAAAAAQ